MRIKATIDFFSECKDRTTKLRRRGSKIITDGYKIRHMKRIFRKYIWINKINAAQWTTEENNEGQKNIRQHILKEKFERAINKVKHNKTMGIDNINEKNI